jgi:ATP-dependent Clp protease ATP-binding subunit ClpB
MATGSRKFGFDCTQSVKDFLLEQGTDPKYGARHLKRAIEKYLVFPLANLMATGQVQRGDLVRIDLNSQGSMTFVKEESGAMELTRLERFPWPVRMPPAAAQPATSTANLSPLG